MWVPFELGRPFGAPDEPAFQTRVLRETLALLERRDGPPILDDFPDDAPGSGPTDMTGWSCPIPLPPAPPSKDPALLADILSEIGTLSPWQTLAVEKRGRTSVGAAGVPIETSARFLHDLLEGEAAADNPSDTLSLGQSLRGASEDLKTFYMEAATAQPGRATSRSVADWFWGATAAGRLLLALHPVCLGAADAGVKRVALSQLIPRLQQHRLN
jgi:hypothetical protein